MSGREAAHVKDNYENHQIPDILKLWRLLKQASVLQQTVNIDIDILL